MFGFSGSKSNKKTKVIPRKYANSKNKKDSSFIHSRAKPKYKRANESKKKFENPLNYIFDFHFNHSRKLFFIFLGLLLVGVIAIFSSTIVFAYRYTGDKYYYLFSQLKLIGVGFLFLSFFYFVRIEVIAKLWYIPFAICIGLLAYLFYLSLTSQAEVIDGATRWVKLGGFQFQPSDFAKLAFVIYMASFLGKLPETYRDANEYFKKNLGPFLGMFLLTVGLVLLGRNLGTALVIAFIGLVCYGATAITRYQKSGFLVICILMVAGGVLFGLYEAYRASRINVWTNYVKTGDTLVKDKDGNLTRDEESYQFDQVLTAVGSGGLSGEGLGESIGKFYFVKTTAGDDSIIGIIAEEFGFIMTTVILLFYVYLIFVCLNLAREMVDNRVYYLLLIGIASWIGFQMFVHVGANIGVIPLTGQTLPFISLGGSSIISLMGAMGIVLNVSKQLGKTKPKNKREEVVGRKAFL